MFFRSRMFIVLLDAWFKEGGSAHKCNGMLVNELVNSSKEENKEQNTDVSHQRQMILIMVG